MKKKLLLASVAFMALHTLHAQDGVGIGKSVIPDATTVLDIGSDSKGILIPRITLTGEGDITTIKGGTYPESLLVYHKKGGTSTLNSGFYFWLDGKWNALVSKTTERTDEVLTTLEISGDKQKVVLTYTGEDKKAVVLDVSDRLQNDPSFQTYIEKISTAKLGTTVVAGGTGVTVAKTSSGDTANPVTTYTVTANPTDITLGGDVTGAAASSKVVAIQNTSVSDQKPKTDQALIFDGSKWIPGMPKIDAGNVTFTKGLLSGADNVIKVDNGENAMLKDVTLSITPASIKTTMIGANEVKNANIDANAVTTDKITNANVTLAKLADGTDANLVLVTGADKRPVWAAQNTIVPQGADLSAADGTIVVANGTGAALKAASLKVGNASITDAHLAANAVTTDKITNANVTPVKIAAGGNSTVLTTDAAGKVAWTNQSEIKPTAAALTTDGIIVIGDATSTTITQADAVLKATTLSVKDNSITVAKLATVAANKNKRLTTDDSGKPQWENKLTFVKATPVATNDVVDGKRVYTVRVTNGTVEEPNTAAPLGYNSIMKAIPVTNLEYLLTAQIYDKTNKLLTSSIVDVTNTKGTSVQFRFGMNNMYTTLPVGVEYIVVLRYVSNEAVTE